MADKSYTHVFTVAGSGQFPLDMLRRDKCHPQAEIDATTAQARGSSLDRHVTLERQRGDRWWHPTFGRWQSFGWRVVSWELVDDAGRRTTIDVVKAAGAVL